MKPSNTARTILATALILFNGIGICLAQDSNKTQGLNNKQGVSLDNKQGNFVSEDNHIMVKSNDGKYIDATDFVKFHGLKPNTYTITPATKNKGEQMFEIRMQQKTGNALHYFAGKIPGQNLANGGSSEFVSAGRGTLKTNPDGTTVVSTDHIDYQSGKHTMHFEDGTTNVSVTTNPKNDDLLVMHKKIIGYEKVIQVANNTVAKNKM